MYDVENNMLFLKIFSNIVVFKNIYKFILIYIYIFVLYLITIQRNKNNSLKDYQDDF